MYKIILPLTAVVVLVGCEGQKDWHKDCNKYYSENSRALAQCEAKVKAEGTSERDITLKSLDVPRTQDEIGRGI